MGKKKEKFKDTASGVSLSNYVEQVCREILTGVLAAQSDTELGKYVGRAPTSAKYFDDSGNSISYIDFNVATEISASRDGGLGVNVRVVKAAGKLGKTSTVSNSIGFSVPLAIPMPKDQVLEKVNLRREKRAAIQAPPKSGF
jgi:hypothetical protein